MDANAAVGGAVTALHRYQASAFPSELPASFRRQLNSKEDPQTALLHLAKFFRNQSSIMLRQAALLEQTALDHHVHESTSSPRQQQHLQQPLQEYLQQTSVTTMVSKAAAVMQSTQAQLDRMESRLHPWDDDAISRGICTTAATVTTSLRGGVRAYSMFMKDEFKHCAQRLGTTNGPTVNKELSRLWKELTVEKKQDYQRRAADELARRKEKRHLPVDEQAAAAAATGQLQITSKRRRSEK